MLLINIIFAMLLVATKFIPNTTPSEFNYLGVLGLLTPVLLVINVFFIFFWLFSKKFFFLILPIAAIWLAWDIFSVCVAGNFSAKQDFTKSKNTFTVLSYNVRLLDLYKWSQDQETRNKMIAFFKEQNASVLCLQEFYSNNDSIGVNNIKAIQDACQYEYYAECNTFVSKRGKWGSIIFSHFPILNTQNFEIDILGNNFMQKVDIALFQDTISIHNVHLKSNRLSKKESALVNKNKLPNFSDSTIEQSKSIFQKLLDNSVGRGLEADLVSASLLQSTKPVILCGDLNDIPSSYVYFKVRGKLKDVFLEQGFGLGKTYRNAIPVLRIDYIFHDERIKSNGYQKFDLPYSDHEPHIANFSIP
jgi:endonuclease/exonuclease/phosphatase family metal-dependent hydrolase